MTSSLHSDAHLHDPDLYERFYNVDLEPDKATLALPGEPRLEMAAYTLPKGATVLDVGCYKGSICIPLQRRRTDLHITGLDISAIAIADAKRLADYLDLPIEFQQGHAEALPFPDESFDAVLLLEILEHVIDTNVVVNEANRVTKPGGLILISSPIGAIEMEGRTDQTVPGYEHLHMHVREYDPGKELAGWPGMIATRRAAPNNNFTFYLAILPRRPIT